MGRKKRPLQSSEDASIAQAVLPFAEARTAPAIAMDHTLAGAFLRQWIRARQASDVQLARVLGVSASQFSNWIHGRELVPSEYWPEIGDELGLTDQMSNVNRIFEATARMIELRRLFQQKRNTSGSPPQQGLSEYFNDRMNVYQRLVDLIEASVSQDALALPHCTLAYHAHVHASAALHCCMDIHKYLVGGADNMFYEKNIEQHLRYPHHLYFAFFLTEVTPADGDQVPQLQTSLFQALETAAAFESSQERVDQRIAQHALHMLARYRGDPVVSYRRSRNPETQRMAFFGEVYHSFDSGPFEELADRIIAGGPFAEATWSFDRLHYRDTRVGKNQPVSAPINAMSRNIAALADVRASMRRVASARIINTLRHLPTSARFSPDFRAHLAAEQPRLEAFRPSGPLEAKARSELISIATASDNGERR